MKASHARISLLVLCALLAASIAPATAIFLVLLGSPQAFYVALFVAIIGFLFLAFLALPALLALRSFNRLSLRTTLLVTAICGLIIGIARFVFADGGTYGYTVYGQFGYRLVESGQLTSAGVIVWVLTTGFTVVMGLLSGVVFWWSGGKFLTRSAL